MSSLNTESYIEPAPLQLGALQQCVLVDLTEVPRVGFRGQQSADYLQARGFSLPDAPNRAITQADGSANYLLPREDSHAWLHLSGVSIAEVMAKLCGVDLRPAAFPPGAVAQTSAARINVIVINLGSIGQPAFQILFDRASLAYFKGAVLDAMAEFDGQELKIETLQ